MHTILKHRYYPSLFLQEHTFPDIGEDEIVKPALTADKLFYVVTAKSVMLLEIRYYYQLLITKLTARKDIVLIHKSGEMVLMSMR